MGECRWDAGYHYLCLMLTLIKLFDTLKIEDGNYA